MVPKRSVLVVDRSEETREVLRTALEGRGLRILAASRARRGLELARQHRPDLIVLDLEVESAGPEALCRPFARQSREHQSFLVMLGTLRRGPSGLTGGELVAKPYHYGPLIRKIEELLDATSQLSGRGG